MYVIWLKMKWLILNNSNFTVDLWQYLKQGKSFCVNVGPLLGDNWKNMRPILLLASDRRLKVKVTLS